MTSLSDYQRSIRALIVADDMTAELQAQGIAADADVLDGRALRAKRLLAVSGGDPSFKQADKMSHRKIVR